MTAEQEHAEARNQAHEDSGEPPETTGTESESEDSGSATGQLVADETAQDMRNRWDAIQGSFVDDPRNAVDNADRLVSDLLQQLSRTFEEQHHELENQWKEGQPSTEDLRTALNRYRSFFNRLLEV